MESDKVLSQLIRRLEKGSAVSTYLILGSDQAGKARAVDEIVARLCEPEYRAWNTERVDGAECDGAALFDLVSTAPMLGDRRVVIVTGAEKLRGEEALLPFIAQPPGFSVLILVGDSLDKRSRLYTAVKRHGCVVEFDVPRGEAMARRAQALAEAAGLVLEPGVAALVAQRVGEDAARLEQEVEKLAVYAGGDGKVDLAAAERLVGYGDPQLGEYALFDYVDAVAEGKVAAALEQLHALLGAGKAPLLILTMIARQLRLLMAAHAWQRSDPKEAAGALGLKSAFPLKKAYDQARRWTLAEIVAALEVCAAWDEAMKRGVDGRHALELLTVTLARRDFAAAPH